MYNVSPKVPAWYPGYTVSNPPYSLINLDFHATSRNHKKTRKSQKFQLIIKLFSTTPCSRNFICRSQWYFLQISCLDSLQLPIFIDKSKWIIQNHLQHKKTEKRQNYNLWSSYFLLTPCHRSLFIVSAKGLHTTACTKIL